MKLKQYLNESTDKTKDFLKKRPSEQIQNIMTVITKALRIPSIDIVYHSGLEDEGEYSGARTRGRYIAFVKDETDTETAIHELIHHVQKFTTKGGDHHGNTWKAATKKVIKILNSKFNLSLTPQMFNRKMYYESEGHNISISSSVK